MKISTIISGGQTGADRGGLEAARQIGLPYGGWVPKGRRAEDGKVPLTYTGLCETESPSYQVRSEANVIDSHATLVLVCGLPVGSTMKTCALALKHGRPCLAVNLAADRKTAVDQIVAWLASLPLPEGVLNVAGSRESKVPGMQAVTRAVLSEVLSRVNGPPLQTGGNSDV